MKVEQTENSVRLVPESDWEIQVLRELRKKGVESLQFQDDWECTGYLQLFYINHQWDKI